ncbi:MAG: hypothetical protein VW779_09270 [Halieaceae bacterium]
MSSDSDDQLRAASFDPKPSAAPTLETSTSPNQSGVWIAGAIGVALLAFVVLVLPSLAPEPATSPSLDTAGSANTASSSDQVTSKRGETEERSPFAEAQMAKARRAAQEALQQLLETQARLEARAVNVWAELEFSEATAVAVEGDVFYREQIFAEAETKYRAAQSALDAIEATLSEEISARLEMLLAAIEASDAEEASGLSQTLSQMAPDSAEVIEAVERVATIPEVAALIESASNLFDQRKFSDALEQIQSAIALDPVHKRLQALTQDYRSALTDDRFQKAMTQGFEALEAGNFAAAKTAFNSAAALKPNDKSPAVALAQAEEAEILSALNRYVVTAERQERDENWEAAAASYKEALMVDPTILSDAQTTVSEAKAALNGSDGKGAMPKLEALWNRAAKVVENASTPLPVTIASDGLTEITIKRVARLGTLTSRTVSLRPGQYQLLGSRVGFRDVLVTLNVGVDRENSIDIRCTEAIGG